MKLDEYEVLKEKIAKGGVDGSRALLELQTKMSPGLVGVFNVVNDTLGFRLAVETVAHEGFHGLAGLMRDGDVVIGAVELELAAGVVPRAFCLSGKGRADTILSRLSERLDEFVDKKMEGEVVLNLSQLRKRNF